MAHEIFMLIQVRLLNLLNSDSQVEVVVAHLLVGKKPRTYIWTKEMWHTTTRLCDIYHPFG